MRKYLPIAFASIFVVGLIGFSSVLDKGDKSSQWFGSAGDPCVSKNGLPDAKCTPGAIFKTTILDICKAGYSKSVRNVPQSLKDAVKKQYGAASWCKGTACEVDHLISLELGGSNDITNLWPEAAPDFHVKDALENKFHAEVCEGSMSLEEAQRQISTDWKSAALREGLVEGGE